MAIKISETVRDRLGEATEYRVKRSDDRDLRFTGWQIGEGHTEGGKRKVGISVWIYLTCGGKLVWSRVYWSGEKRKADAGECGVVNHFKALLKGLQTGMTSRYGKRQPLPPVEKAAFESIGKTYPEFLSGIECEHVD